MTLGGYERRWIPPGSFGEDTSNVGVGHLFVSHDHGEHFTDISGNLPDIPANWTAFHDGSVLVATDLGVYVQSSPGSTAGTCWHRAAQHARVHDPPEPGQPGPVPGRHLRPG